MNSPIYLVILFSVLSCRLSYTNAEFRTINGEVIDIKDSSHSVSIFRCSVYRCAGSLISLNSVLTVADCGFEKPWDDLDVLAGETDIGKINTRGVQQRKVQDIIFDPDYNRESRFMNIAVIKVEGDFLWTFEVVMPIALCDTVLKPGRDMHVNGWGSVTLGSTAANPLLKTTKMPIIPRDQCQDYYGILPSTVICGGCSTSTLNNGDAGAGALVNNHLCAVAHGGSNSLNVPNLFTDLTSPRVREFLREHTHWRVLL